MHSPLAEYVMSVVHSTICEGDKVQYVSQGVKQFEKPKRVIDIKKYKGERYAFFEDYKTGIPTNKLIRS